MRMGILTVFGGILVAMGAGLPVSSAATGVALGCLPQSDAVAPICAQLRDTIAGALNGQEVALHAADALPEDRLAVRLHVEALTATGMTAHLEWRVPGALWQRGETMSLSVMDRALSAPMTGRFMKTLWEGSNVIK